jgi:hypothetical protein
LPWVFLLQLPAVDVGGLVAVQPRLKVVRAGSRLGA